MKILSILRAEYVKGHTLRLFFSDRRVVEVDFTEFIRLSALPDVKRYWPVKKFRTFRIEHGDLIWGDFEMLFPIGDLYRNAINRSQEEKAA